MYVGADFLVPLCLQLCTNEGFSAFNGSCSPSGRITLSNGLAFLLKVV